MSNGLHCSGGLASFTPCDLYLPRGEFLEQRPNVFHKLPVIDPTERRRVLLELIEGFGELRSRPVQVSPVEVVQPNGSLHQTLIEKAERTAGLPPQVFPGFMGVKEPAGVEKIYSILQGIAHRPGPLSY